MTADAERRTDTHEEKDMAVSYTGVVTVTGEGRNGGQVTASDGLLSTALAIPKALGGAGGATNPEQLFAAGWGRASWARCGVPPPSARSG